MFSSVRLTLHFVQDDIYGTFLLWKRGRFDSCNSIYSENLPKSFFILPLAKGENCGVVLRYRLSHGDVSMTFSTAFLE
jgi:hypothetical protein